jgi:hypothetical protein
MTWGARLTVLAAVLFFALTACSTTVTPPAAGPSSGPAAAWVRLPASPLPARHEAAGAWLGGQFVLVGGWDDPPCPPAAACVPPARPALRDGAGFDPATGSWRRIADAPVPVATGSWGAPVVLGDTMYLLTGSADRHDSPKALLAYDPSTDVWTRLPAPPARDGLSLVAAGTRLVASDDTAGRRPAVDYVFDLSTKRWQALPRDPLGKSWGRSAVWLGDRLLLTANGTNLDADSPAPMRIAALDRDLRRWRRLPDADLHSGTFVVAAGSLVYAFADYDGSKRRSGQVYPNAVVFDPDGGIAHLLPSPPGSTGLVGYLLAVGDRALVGEHLIDPTTRKWTVVPTQPWPNEDARTVIANDTTIFAWGGANHEENLADGWLLTL